MKEEFGRLFKHSSIYSIGNIAMRAGAFILLPLYTRYLTVSEYGILELLNATSQIVTSLVGIGLAHATLRFYFEYDEASDRKAVISTAMLSSLVITGASIFLLSFLSGVISRTLFDSEAYILALNITLTIIVFEMGRQIGLAYMRAKEYSVYYVVLCFAQFVIQVACNIYTVAFLKLGVNGVLIGNMLSVLIGMLVCLFLIVKECGIRYHFSKFKDMFNYSYPFLFNGLLSAILSNADRFILKVFLSMDAVGIYGLTLKFAALLNDVIVEPFQKSFGAFRFSIMKNDNVNTIQSRTLGYLIFIVSWAGLGLSLMISDIIHLLTTPEYYSASRYIPLAVLAYTIASTNYIFQTGVLYNKQTIKIFYTNIISGAVGLSLLCLLVNFMGLYGACLTLIVQQALSTSVINYFSQNISRVEYEYWKVSAAIATSVIIYLLSLLTLNLNFMAAIAVKSVMLMLYPVALYYLGYFSKEEVAFAHVYVNKIIGR